MPGAHAQNFAVFVDECETKQKNSDLDIIAFAELLDIPNMQYASIAAIEEGSKPRRIIASRDAF